MGDLEVILFECDHIYDHKNYRARTTPKTTPKIRDKIVTMIKENPNISKDDLAKNLGITPDGIRYHIRILTREHKLKWVGSSKGGHWEIVN